ncbi:MAG: YvcK family protein [Candidatus Levybacteria bacterium]|nr:YvcK family protein [Candidatus Levybacteria bacterium]
MVNEMNTLQGKHIVCLGGGIGTVNLLKGLKHYGAKLTVIVSMADEGGSSGRLKRLYNVFPSGDLISCMAALTNDEAYASLLTYRFPGNRYGNDSALSGHKLGNLLMVAAQSVSSSYQEAIDLLRKMTNTGDFIYPATAEHVRLTALTVDGTKVEGEENIDLGKYNGK